MKTIEELEALHRNIITSILATKVRTDVTMEEMTDDLLDQLSKGQNKFLSISKEVKRYMKEVVDAKVENKSLTDAYDNFVKDLLDWNKHFIQTEEKYEQIDAFNKETLEQLKASEIENDELRQEIEKLRGIARKELKDKMIVPPSENRKIQLKSIYENLNNYIEYLSTLNPKRRKGYGVYTNGESMYIRELQDRYKKFLNPMSQKGSEGRKKKEIENSAENEKYNKEKD